MASVVVSIVGRFLAHSRRSYFENAGDGFDLDGDWMQRRNFDRGSRRCAIDRTVTITHRLALTSRRMFWLTTVRRGGPRAEGSLPSRVPPTERRACGAPPTVLLADSWGTSKPPSPRVDILPGVARSRAHGYIRAMRTKSISSAHSSHRSRAFCGSAGEKFYDLLPSWRPELNPRPGFTGVFQSPEQIGSKVTAIKALEMEADN